MFAFLQQQTQVISRGVARSLRALCFHTCSNTYKNAFMPYYMYSLAAQAEALNWNEIKGKNRRLKQYLLQEQVYCLYQTKRKLESDYH